MTYVVYTLRNGSFEYRVPKDEWDKMIARNPTGGFNKLREEDEKAVKVGKAPEVERVKAAPMSPAKAAKTAPRKSEPKEVRTPTPAPVKFRATAEEMPSAENDETNPAEAGNQG